jgi:hypothetical protein
MPHFTLILIEKGEQLITGSAGALAVRSKKKLLVSNGVLSSESRLRTE